MPTARAYEHLALEIPVQLSAALSAGEPGRFAGAPPGAEGAYFEALDKNLAPLRNALDFVNQSLGRM